MLFLRFLQKKATAKNMKVLEEIKDKEGQEEDFEVSNQDFQRSEIFFPKELEVYA